VQIDAELQHLATEDSMVIPPPNNEWNIWAPENAGFRIPRSRIYARILILQLRGIRRVVKIYIESIHLGTTLERTTLELQIGLLLENSCLNRPRPLLGFAAKVRSKEKFWKHPCSMNSPFKFVRVLQVKDRLNARAFFDPMDSSRGCSYLDII